MSAGRGAAKALARIPKKSVVASVCEQLEEQIFTGAFPSGKALPPERELCRMLGVSRTPVREALARLERAGLVAVRHGGETMVLEFRETAGLDLLPRMAIDPTGRVRLDVMRACIEMRAALAPEIARLCAQRAPLAYEHKLRQVIAEMEAVNAHSAQGLATLQELSMRFWSIVIEGTDNIAYQLAFNSLRRVYGGMREQVAKAMADELSDLDGYRALARAIGARAADSAALAAREHVALGLEPMLELFRGKKRRS
jgi:DNA-binding FadR family transcriptional regulator